MNNLKNLLQNVAIIQKKYDDIAKITGENFNIFSVLKMDSKEVRMHSAFIGELLNPKGSHGLEDKPLKFFIELLNNKFNGKDIINDTSNKFILDTESSVAIIEKYIGTTNDDKTEGGRIDIIIEDKNKNAIIIENKIYAIEQTNQLIRYNNYSKNSPILYLTLFGAAPTSHGNLDENEDYFNISYQNDIKQWLKICLKEAVEFPMLREVIKQYLYLIKKLTNQTTNEKMSQEVIQSILNNTESINTSKLIFENYNRALDILKSNEIIGFIEMLVENGFKKEDISIDRSVQKTGFFITLKTYELKENEFYDFGINVELNLNYYFFCLIKKGKNKIDKKNNDPIFSKIREELHAKIEGLIITELSIGFSKEWTIGLNKEEYYLPDINNASIYLQLLKTFKTYKNMFEN